MKSIIYVRITTDFILCVCTHCIYIVTQQLVRLCLNLTLPQVNCLQLAYIVKFRSNLWLFLAVLKVVIYYCVTTYRGPGILYPPEVGLLSAL